jgi:hypothetical protein
MFARFHPSPYRTYAGSLIRPPALIEFLAAATEDESISTWRCSSSPPASIG